jgi:hypothetical protein
MASWIVDEFKVKPAGLLAAWRYKRVLVSDSGIITNEDVPGKPDMNLPCTTDYRKTDRRIFPKDSTGQPLIVQFCNLDTKTNYRVYAQDCTPFAFVQLDVNATKCGYLTPLPTPGSPTLPFSLPTYGAYTTLEDCTDTGEPLIVNLYRKNYTGTVSDLETAGNSPVVLSYREPSLGEYGIQACECVLSFRSTSNFSLAQFYTQDEREWLLEVIVAGVTKFKGYLTPDSATQEFKSAPAVVTLRANDGIGALKNVTYPMPVGTKNNLRQSFVDILSYAMAVTNLQLGFNTVNNLYESKNLTGLDDDPMAQNKVNPLRMSDGQGNIYNAYDVIETLCQQFGATFRQADGAFHFIRNSEMTNEVIRNRVYNKDAFFLRGENVDRLRTAGASDQDVILIGGNPTISLGNAYKRVEVLMKYGDIPSIIFNGDFELYTAPNFPFWSKVGGIDITRIQRTVNGSGGTPVNIENYAAQFNLKADNAKYFEAEAIPVLKGDKISFGIRVSAQKFRSTHGLRIRFKIGNNWLYNDPDNNPDTYDWITSLETATLFINQSNTAVYYSLSLPDIPINGDLTIQVFGFEDRGTGRTDLNPVLWIDDVSLNKSNSIDKNAINGILSISDQNAFYTLKPDRIELIYGDYDTSNFQVRPERAPQPTIENNMFAIYTSDGSYSTGWYEYGLSKAPAIIGLSLARSILKMHQQPYRKLFTDLEGDNLSINDIYQISVPNETDFSQKKFIILSGDFDLKHRKAYSVQLMEVFYKNIVTNDASVPHKSGVFDIKEQLSMSIDQNPSNISQSGGGIFTEQFTQEFS